MSDYKFFSKCHNCKKKKFFISKRKVKLPTGQEATSQDLFCGKCYKGVLKLLSTNHTLNGSE